MRLGLSGQIFEKYSNVKFNENPSSGSRVVPCGRTDETKLIVAFCNFAYALKRHKLVQRAVRFSQLYNLIGDGGGLGGGL